MWSGTFGECGPGNDGLSHNGTYTRRESLFFKWTFYKPGAVCKKFDNTNGSFLKWIYIGIVCVISDPVFF